MGFRVAKVRPRESRIQLAHHHLLLSCRVIGARKTSMPSSGWAQGGNITRLGRRLFRRLRRVGLR